ncbi:uncharacterized protein BDV17DRAFT_275894 [Aspergillus undulatus]|uniref:uncharacterized protein n=1 Tax=Aspergillus undulatus TaxID=1810928 RepID=UPI003CCD6D02
MVRSPMTPSLRTAAHPLTTMSARARTSISSSKYLSSRSFSTPCTRALGPRSLISSGRALPRSSHRNPPRPFASASRRYYGGSNRYNRFDGQQRQSFIAQSMAKARPVHFVIVGGVLGGFYVYNTDTVEVGRS